MSISKYTDFVGKNEALPSEIKAQLQLYIDRYEPKIVAELIGYELSKEFFAGLEEETIDVKWTNLRDGADYRDSCDILRKFDGLKNAIVADVYYQYTTENQQFASEVGMKMIASQNSENADPAYKQEIALNLVVDINEQCKGFIDWSNDEVADTYENYIYTKKEKVTHFNF